MPARGWRTVETGTRNRALCLGPKLFVGVTVAASRWLMQRYDPTRYIVRAFPPATRAAVSSLRGATNCSR